MSYSPLVSLTPKDRLKTIFVRVIRKWEFRGINDDGPLQHIDLILADTQVIPIILFADLPLNTSNNLCTCAYIFFLTKQTSPGKRHLCWDTTYWSWKTWSYHTTLSKLYHEQVQNMQCQRLLQICSSSLHAWINLPYTCITHWRAWFISQLCIQLDTIFWTATIHWWQKEISW